MPLISPKTDTTSPEALNAQLPFMSVLVADDNYASRTIMKTLLEREECEVSLAHNGRIATQLSALDKFDLILMDLQMPIMDGIEASRIIRAKCPHNQETPIFAVTAYADPSISASVNQAGMNHIVLKPFRIGDITAAWKLIERPNHVGVIHQAAPQAPHLDASAYALLDSSVLAPLCAAASASVLSRVMDRFWESTSGFIESLQSELPKAMAGDKDSVETFRKAAHALKGSAANIGILKGSKLAAQLQNAKPENMETILYQLTQCLSVSRPELDSFVELHASKTGL